MREPTILGLREFQWQTLRGSPLKVGLGARITWLQAKIEYDVVSRTENKVTFAFIVHEHDVFRFPAPGASRRNLKETSFSEKLYVFFVELKCTEGIAFHAFIVSQIANSQDTGQL